MKCPHCRIDFHAAPEFTYIGQDKDGYWATVDVTCSACKKYVIFLQRGSDVLNSGGRSAKLANVRKETMVYPKGSLRAHAPPEVPAEIAEDFREACLVLADSPKASAALSRRCLQHLLRSVAGIKAGDLATEIQQVLDAGRLPTALADSIDAVRNIGNFSAHPIKSKATGEILPVEPHEAEWTLDVLESLFDFYYVQPAVVAKKRAALDAKLSSAGKPPVK